ncbi:hypothetical protein ACI2KT_07565 [Ensifer adhaerens]|jgi:hypothetical protein|uniref:Uncharacterized protein n=1 Tax=Ensifer adhaerens TaxID=106592 RepID=A0A9Q8Y423_ENSAD|nr:MULTISPECIES: hypothetical protein [Ensifer]KSV71219.1 hypothetical protein N185_03195 [Sinorhizobium sp. GW3]KSV74304.1 hypothetical protein N182_04635 [Sinorhizobium sp. GL2]OWZ94406.1 hypothetical protein B9J07_08070 [Sinorhizobium sp. LM21]KQX60485.1 hypothetical protein ASD49_01660 [Ensifer sp. Root1298]KQX94187.1 hypothetical protein ASD41_01655 [Ensifer sp. Root1312]
MTPNANAAFKPAKTSASDKAAATDHTARAIVAAEKIARDKKTEKLKAQRLERAAAEPAAEVSASKPTRKSRRS